MIEHGLLSFGSLLREKLDELDADEADQDAFLFDPIERLRLDARQAVLADHLGPLARPGHEAYLVPTETPARDPGKRHLNILY